MSFEHVLATSLVPGEPGVFVLGCYERNVSIYLQQVRALNLIHVATSSGLLKSGDRVAVVGGGFSGLSAAAAAAVLGMSVTVLERNRALLEYQRDNRVRWIHPHIHEWPRPRSTEDDAGLALLNWSAALAGDMAEQVLEQWQSIRERHRIELVLRAEDIELAREADRPALRWGGPQAGRSAFDAVILALGLGMERSFGVLPLRSYWLDPTVVQPGNADAPTRHLVSGIGEGGVIDALYLVLEDFSHIDVVRTCLDHPGMAAVRKALLEIEAEAEPLGDEGKSALFTARYEDLPVPQEVDHRLAKRRRRDTAVTLNGPESDPLSPKADVLNRFLISRLLKLEAMTFLSGLMSGVEPSGKGYALEFDTGHAETFDHVHIRHGTVPTLKKGFPAIWVKYLPERQKHPFDVPRRMWPAGRYSRLHRPAG